MYEYNVYVVFSYFVVSYNLMSIFASNKYLFPSAGIIYSINWWRTTCTLLTGMHLYITLYCVPKVAIKTI